MLYQICNGAVRFAAATVLENINFEIRNTEKIAVVGRNGCGKTTLLKLIAGEVELSKRDSDEDIYITQAGQPVIGYLKQVAFENEEESLENEVKKAFAHMLQIREEMDELAGLLEHDGSEENCVRFSFLQEQFQILGGYSYEKEFELVLKKFGFGEEDKQKPISQFSGGQRTKIAFARMLLSRPDILLLDEPTNHLDMDTICWLEEYLKEYNRAVVIVSHDRMFLDKVADVVYEIEYKTAKRYPGNYSAFVERKRLNWEKQKKDYELQKKEIERLQALIERFKNKPTKVAMTRSKLKQIEHMVKIEPPARYDLKSFHVNFTPARESVTDVLSVEHLQIGYDRILSEVTFQQKKGSKIGIIGDNGVGKSTLLRTLCGQLPPLGGSYNWGVQADIGYFEQQMAQFQSEKTVLDEFWDNFPDLKQNEIRSALGAFLFGGEEVFKTVDMLSGGEKVRLVLAHIFKRRPNVLILDEPTNHMDMVGKTALEAMLKAYEGTVLFVSHDRYFVKEVSDSLLVFSGGRTYFYPYGYQQYMEEQEKTEQVRKVSKAPAAEMVKEKQDIAGKGQSGKFSNPGRDAARMQKRMEKLESLIRHQEELITQLDAQLLDSNHQSDYVLLSGIQKQQQEESDKLLAYMEEWESISGSCC